MYLTGLKKALVIAKYQFKLILNANIALAFALCLLTPFLFGMRYLDNYGSSFVLERFVSLVGIILLTPLFVPEQDKNIAELVQSKRTYHTLTVALRLVMSLLLMALCIAVMVAVMRYCHCVFETGRFYIGTFATALFLGAIGFIFHAMTNNVIVGYLAAFTYYLLNFTSGIKLKNLYLFSLARNSMNEKFWLLGVGLFLILGSVLWKHYYSKMP